MLVIGVDVHKQSLTAAAVEETGRLLAERTLSVSEDGLLASAPTRNSLVTVASPRCLKRQLARTVYTTLKTESALT
jgi:hypothetical protein